MNKKTVMLVAALTLLCVTGSFAAGIGLQYSGNAGKIYTNGVALTYKTDEKPVVFALSYYLGDDPTVGLTLDYWLFNNQITTAGTSSVNWFFGVGAFTSALFADDFGFTGGIRLPIGLNMMIDKKIEPFFQVVPSIGLALVPNIKATHVYFPVTGGFRIWF